MSGPSAGATRGVQEDRCRLADTAAASAAGSCPPGAPCPSSPIGRCFDLNQRRLPNARSCSKRRNYHFEYDIATVAAEAYEVIEEP